MSTDDHTLVGGWRQDFGQQELTTLPQPPLLDAKTSRAVRVLCWTVTVILWLGLLLGAVVVLGLAVGIASSPSLT